MLTTFEGKLSKWQVDPKDNTVALCELRLQICKANILDLYRIAGQPADFTIHTSQMELPFKRDGRQMGLDDAPVADDGSDLAALQEQLEAENDARQIISLSGQTRQQWRAR